MPPRASPQSSVYVILDGRLIGVEIDLSGAERRELTKKAETVVKMEVKLRGSTEYCTWRYLHRPSGYGQERCPLQACWQQWWQKVAHSCNLS